MPITDTGLERKWAVVQARARQAKLSQGTAVGWLVDTAALRRGRCGSGRERGTSVGAKRGGSAGATKGQL